MCFPVWLRSTRSSNGIVEIAFVVDLVGANQLAGGGVVDFGGAVAATVGETSRDFALA